MPTRNPRLAITLDRETRAIIDRLSTLTKQPASRIVSDCMTESAPVLHRIADAIERVKLVTESRSAAIRAALSTAETQARENAAAALALLDRIAADEPVPGVASARGGGPGPARRRRSDPPTG